MCSQVLWINQRKPDIRLNFAWLEVFGNSPIAGAKMERELAGIDRQPADGRGVWDNLTLLFVKSASPTPLLTGVSPGREVARKTCGSSAGVTP